MSIEYSCQKIFKICPIIPVIVIDDIDKAIPLAEALQAGGISIMEVTLRTPNALAIIEKIATKLPNIIIGAGTVVNEELYHKSIKHGAKFIVSPGVSNTIINVAKEYTIPLIPGAITPSEIMQACDAEFNYLKFFPAENFNGKSTLKSLANVFPHVKFCPTGGITLDNAKDYLALPNVAGIGTSVITSQDLIIKNDFKKITQLAQNFMNLI